MPGFPLVYANLDTGESECPGCVKLKEKLEELRSWMKDEIREWEWADQPWAEAIDSTLDKMQALGLGDE